MWRQISTNTVVLGFGCNLDVGTKFDWILMLPIPSTQYLVHEQILGLIGNIRIWEYIQLRPDVLSTEFSGYFSMGFCWGKIGPQTYFPFDLGLRVVSVRH